MSIFNGTLTITNNKQNAPHTTNVNNIAFAFQGSCTLSVSVSGLSSQTFTLSNLPLGIGTDTITATPGTATGTFDGQMNLMVPVTLNDTHSLLSPHPQTVHFPLSTSGSLTMSSAGSTAQGSPLNNQTGAITLVGSANVVVSILGFSEGIGVGLVVKGILSPVPTFAGVSRTWLSASGNPLVRFTGSTHDWSNPIANSNADTGKPILGLNLTVTTGSDDLRGGSNANDNANVMLTLSDGQIITTSNINAGQDWGNNSVHTVPLQFPSGLTAGQIVTFDLHTQFGGGISGDNWNVNELNLQACLSNAVVGPPPPQPIQVTLVNTTGNPIVRFTGSTHNWSTAISVPASEAGKVVQNLDLTVTTGSDDIRGGSNPSDNANAIITLSNGQTITTSNINAGQDWGNNSVHSVTLQISSGLLLGDIVQLTLNTEFGGGIGGDNWNVNGIQLIATAE